MATVAAPAYLAKRGTPRVPEDLANHNCILGGKFGPDWSFKKGRETVTIRAKGNLWVENGDAIREAASGGVGIAHSTRWLFRKDLETGSVVSLLDEFQREGVPVSVLYPSSRHLPARSRQSSIFSPGTISRVKSSLVASRLGYAIGGHVRRATTGDPGVCNVFSEMLHCSAGSPAALRRAEFAQSALRASSDVNS